MHNNTLTVQIARAGPGARPSFSSCQCCRSPRRRSRLLGQRDLAWVCSEHPERAGAMACMECRCRPSCVPRPLVRGARVARLLLLAERRAVRRAEGRADADRAANDVAEGDREKVGEEEGLPRDGSAAEDAKRDDEHVGDRVLEAERDEGGDREPDCHHLACGVLGERGHVHGHAHQPVAQDSPDERRLKRQARLRDRRPDRRAAADERASEEDEGREGDGADEVAGVRSDPRLGELVRLGLAFERGHGDQRSVAGEELCPSHQCHEQSEW
mmetsp:Transcript_20987/g.35955  ORF Transcript_20987/g.35955 Transcript_20987/m.35955 type:complete len:271 (-) Transcript_20987:456-1268(-)